MLRLATISAVVALIALTVRAFTRPMTRSAAAALEEADYLTTDADAAKI